MGMINAQSDAEPQEIVEARKRIRECNAWHDCQQCTDDAKLIAQYEAAPPRPDASAGLIEAAEKRVAELERHNRLLRARAADSSTRFADSLARAADRSVK